MSMNDSEHSAETVGRLIGRRFSTAVVLFQSAVAERLGVNVTDWKFAEILTRTGPTNPGRLSEITGMTSPATAQVINRLERAGIVRRGRDPDDKRKVIVHLVSNPRILDTTNMIFSEFGKEMSKLMMQYTTSELDVITSFVEGATQILESEAARLRKEDG